LPGRLLTLGRNAITALGNALRNGLGALRSIASSIVTSIVNIIKTLPGKLLGIGGALLAAGVTLGGKILGGIRSGISAIGDMAGSIASSLRAGINAAIGLPKTLSFKVLGKGISFTIPGFAKGGIVPGGLALVGEGGPELVSLPRGSRVHSNRESKKMVGSGLPKRVILRIGDRDFVAYVEELADNRINAADNLAWQGA
jgi:phage-related protein